MMKQLVLVGVLVGALGSGAAYAQAGHAAPKNQPGVAPAVSAPGGELQLGSVHLANAVKADGKALAIGLGSKDRIQAKKVGDKRSILLWNPVTAEEIGRLEGHTDTIGSLAFSPDGKLLASGSYDGTIRLWDVPSRKEVNKLTGHKGRVTTVAFAPSVTLTPSSSRQPRIISPGWLGFFIGIICSPLISDNPLNSRHARPLRENGMSPANWP